MLRSHLYRYAATRGQQRDLQAVPAHARLPGVVAPAQDQVVLLDRHDDGFPPAIFDALVRNDEIANRNGLPACLARGGVALARRDLDR